MKKILVTIVTLTVLTLVLSASHAEAQIGPVPLPANVEQSTNGGEATSQPSQLTSARSATALPSTPVSLPLIEIVAASAPNPLRSPNSGTWKAIAAGWLETKTGAGDPTVNPAAFASSTVITAGDLMVVPSDSQTHLWKGIISPTGTLTSGEFGNRVAFVFSIKSMTPFRMSNIRTTLTCSDSRLNATEMLSPYVFNSYTVGVSYG
ncbi:hypothetical protein EB052_00610, partial [bacterium]|nr:hypothetical protein [bacterium]